jgi:type I restriction enzyme M protein
MAIKKSDLYSSLWASCDELRGGMDASQYKDYVLFMLFIKYVSDKYGDSDDMAPPVTIPPGSSFKDMIALKGKPDIGDRINKNIIQPLVEANSRLSKSDFPDFNDPNKLGEGNAMVERLSNLIAIFQKPHPPSRRPLRRPTAADRGRGGTTRRQGRRPPPENGRLLKKPPLSFNNRNSC